MDREILDYKSVCWKEGRMWRSVNGVLGEEVKKKNVMMHFALSNKYNHYSKGSGVNWKKVRDVVEWIKREGNKREGL